MINLQLYDEEGSQEFVPTTSTMTYSEKVASATSKKIDSKTKTEIAQIKSFKIEDKHYEDSDAKAYTITYKLSSE